MPDLFSLGYEGGEGCELIEAKQMETFGRDSINGQWQDYHHTAQENHTKLGGDIFVLELGEKEGPPTGPLAYMGQPNLQFNDAAGAFSETTWTEYSTAKDYRLKYGFNQTPKIGTSLHHNLLTPRPDESNTIAFIGAAQRTNDKDVTTHERNQGHWGNTYAGCKAARCGEYVFCDFFFPT